ncbi:GNAT family N-acetyltransferase [Shouchella lehensis]|uniref:N-acetyltransferase n=1 Tax=Shouchella lehensis G1 TaxID=1246626 RepID=A0A060M6J8_9BACI|nr:GNAT family N-acetyltransferase [Shouchella lehensis]AIC96188.1 N-acetyltransferase [Shouchella lehensis G1]
MLRKATEADVNGIASIHVQSWFTTYTGIIKSEILAGISVENRATSWSHHVKDKDQLIYVYERDGHIVGFASARQSTALILTIYILEDNQGEGIGKMLIQTILKELASLGHQKATVEVLEANSSKSFYERMGASLIERKLVPQYGEGNVLLTYRWDAM